MTIFNGEKHLLEQLDSLRFQTRQPEEVLIVDDCSTDGSVSLVKSYIEENNLSSWRIIKNEVNIGWKANFINAFNMAIGEVIFCADQDDIWENTKISEMMKRIENNESISALACNIEPFYETSKVDRVPKYIIKKYGHKVCEQVHFDKKWDVMLRPGCSMCFKKSLLPYIKEVWFPELAHDSAIWVAALLFDSAYILNINLVKFRRHLENNSPKRGKQYETRIKSLAISKTRTQKMIALAKKNGYIDKIKKMNKTLSLINQRIDFIDHFSFLKAFKIFMQIRLFPSFRTFLGDCSIAIKHMK